MSSCLSKAQKPKEKEIKFCNIQTAYWITKKKNEKKKKCYETIDGWARLWKLSSDINSIKHINGCKQYFTLNLH